MRQRAKHRHTDTHTHTHTQVNLGMDHAEGLTQTSMRGNKLGLQFVIPFLYLCLATWTRWRRCSPWPARSGPWAPGTASGSPARYSASRGTCWCWRTSAGKWWWRYRRWWRTEELTERQRQRENNFSSFSSLSSVLRELIIFAFLCCRRRDEMTTYKCTLSAETFLQSNSQHRYIFPSVACACSLAVKPVILVLIAPHSTICSAGWGTGTQVMTSDDRNVCIRIHVYMSYSFKLLLAWHLWETMFTLPLLAPVESEEKHWGQWVKGCGTQGTPSLQLTAAEETSAV